MKKVLLVILMLFCITQSVYAQEKAEWTFLFYFCGTDLESEQGSATLNLKEISQTIPNSQVNVLIQTGGAKSWRAKNAIRLDINPNKLQRWTYTKSGFTLVDEKPLAAMNDPQTLSDFIHWGVANYPAEKFGLLTWDHGGGSRRGIISDELFPNREPMHIKELGQALQNGGVRFEAIMLDLCLGGSLDFAVALEPYAHYMFGSEELVDGKGSNYKGFLQYLYDNPQCDGAHFGRAVCNTMQEKYAEEKLQRSGSALTFSVIDLSKIPAVSEAWNNYLKEVTSLLTDPMEYSAFADFTKNTEMYGYTHGFGMYDAVDLAQRSKGVIKQETINTLRDTVDDAVVYLVKGDSRSYGHGISVYFAPEDSLDNVIEYAENCAFPYYLAFMDAIHPDWDAPTKTYEKIARLAEIDPEKYNIQYSQHISQDRKHLELQITRGVNAVMAVDYALMTYDDQNEVWLSLGTSGDVAGDFSAGSFKDEFNGYWTYYDDSLCVMDLAEEGDDLDLYNIPLFIDGQDDPSYLRASYEHKRYEQSNAGSFFSKTSRHKRVYTVYGIWEGFNASTQMPERSVSSLSDFSGKGYQPIYYEIDWDTHETDGYYSGSNSVFSQEAEIKYNTLPSGYYGFFYIIRDVFGNIINTPSMIIEWNGSNAVFHVLDELK